MLNTIIEVIHLMKQRFNLTESNKTQQEFHIFIAYVIGIQKSSTMASHVAISSWVESHHCHLRAYEHSSTSDRLKEQALGKADQ